jgi:uncharacterized membrane protein
MALFKFIHLLAVLVWIGGMFFAYMILRPAAVEALEPPMRLRLWNAVFQRFFNWVWGAVGTLLVSGFYMIYLYNGITNAPTFVHIMLALGLVMMGIYGYVFFACYVPLSLHVNKQRWKEAGEMLAKIRQLVAVNLTIGIVIMLVVFVGRGW